MSLVKLKEYLQEYSYLRSIQSLLYWDMETLMPKGAIEDRAKRLSYVQSKIHAHVTSSKYRELLDQLERRKLNPMERKLLNELRWDYSIQHALPEKYVTELTHTQTIASHAWAEARKKNDWEAFRPHLQKIIDLKRRETKYYKSKRPYDSLIQLHDKEFTSEQIQKLFSELKAGLEVLIPKVKKQKTFVKIKDLKGPLDVEAQKKLSHYVMKLSGLSDNHARLDESAHPFSINISPLDQRITTRYTTANLDSLSSTMHEVGHALYEHNLPREWEGTPFQEAISYSVHESQSRFWENMIGRSKEFCEFLHPKMRELFPVAMKGIEAEELFHIFNRSVPGLIRVESSELYYNLHIILRFEIEELVINQGLNTKDLPEIWNQKYKDYLGLVPKNFASGILQDSHWAGGAFGYFPTYTLGNLISGSLYQKMKKEVPGIQKDIRKGSLVKARNFLKDTVHAKGRSMTAQEVVGPIEVNDYLAYLSEKFGV